MNSQRPESSEEESDSIKEAFREFVYHAVHDLREPLRAVSTSSEMLIDIYGDSTDERATRCLHYIQEGTGRMEALLRDIAAYCDGEGRKLHLAKVSLEGVLSQVRQQMTDELQKSAAVLSHDPLPTVKGDSFGIAIIFHHLIENACKFRSAEAPCIHIGCIRNGSEWILSVRDNGLGFKSAYASALFRPFKRLHGKEYPGSGLGLALTRKILDRHSGRIWVESTPGRGSTFSFTLPALD